MEEGFGQEINACTYRQVQNGPIWREMMCVGVTIVKYQFHLASVTIVSSCLVLEKKMDSRLYKMGNVCGQEINTCVHGKMPNDSM